jgi:transcriptional regulator with XRE-family HTH domain
MKAKRTKNEFAIKVDKYISSKIHDLRLDCGITQTQLAKDIDVSTQQVQKYEKAVNRISIGRLALIAKSLGKPLEYFFNCCEMVHFTPVEDPKIKFASEMTRKLMKISKRNQQEAVANLIDSLLK